MLVIVIIEHIIDILVIPVESVVLVHLLNA